MRAAPLTGQPPSRTRGRWRIEFVVGGMLIVSCMSTIGAIAFTTNDEQEQAASPQRVFTAAASRPLRAVKRALGHVGGMIPPSSTCIDNMTECSDWARGGECERNPGFMLISCKKSCRACAGHAKFDENCKDLSSFCGQWAAVGECDSNPSYMRHSCPVTCHLCQSAACHDVDRLQCAADAKRGLCRTEPERMFAECRWACKWCAMETSTRCRRPPDMKPAAVAGTVDYMFRRAVDERQHGHLRPVVHSRDPWVVSFESFLSADEADRIIRIGGRRWTRSQAGDGVQAVRTSSTAWCDHRSCGADPVLAAVRRRIANLTLVPERNAEHLQVLKYETGQFYKVHHDQNSPTTSAWGPRMYTFFMYLNDAPAGGETRFPQLNLSVTPKRGRALLWTSVLDDDPHERDFRTEHEAVVVEAGQKFAANYWLHMYDFQLANDRGCGNSEVFGNW